MTPAETHFNQQCAWYKIRDLVLGTNLRMPNITLALKLAAVCEHPDAVWLTKLFAGRDVKTLDQTKQVFFENKENSVTAECFYAMLGYHLDNMQGAAKKGSALAQAQCAGRTSGDASLLLAEQSAAQGERDGFYALGLRVKNTELAKENLLRACELGLVAAWTAYAEYLKGPERYLWLGKAAKYRVSTYLFIREMKDEMWKFERSGKNRDVVFSLGRALKGNVDVNGKTIFGKEVTMVDLNLDPAINAIRFYEEQLAACRRAVDDWSMLARRFGVVKDIRLLIAKLIWIERDQAKYVISEPEKGK
jgi:hypothetical protein